MSSKTFLKLFFVAFLVLCLDFVSKGLVNFYLQKAAYAPTFFPHGGLAVFQNLLGVDFCIHHVTNRGAAWGVGGAFQHVILLIRIVVVVGLVFYMRYSFKAVAYRYPLAMVVAGGLGNILDYFVYGHVIDMFHFIFWGYSFPVFNVADSSIFLGVVWMLASSFISQRKNDDIPQTE